MALMQEIPIPQLGTNDVLVRVVAVSLNYRDITISKGFYPLPLCPDPVPVSDGADVIVALDQHQFGPLRLEHIENSLGGLIEGVLSHYAVLPAEFVIPLPRNLSFIEGSTLPVAGLTAWNALFGDHGRPLKHGQWVLTQGTGGCWCESDRNQFLGNESGQAEEDHPEWGQAAKDLTPDKRGVDLVVDIGGIATFGQSLKAIKTDGFISMVGFRGGLTGEQPSLVDWISSFAFYEGMNRVIEANNIKPVVDERVFKFEHAKEAFEYMEGGTQFGKVCIRVATDI
ncbi:alcohol dehydrogenase [Lipomyces tetrasporus]